MFEGNLKIDEKVKIVRNTFECLSFQPSNIWHLESLDRLIHPVLLDLLLI